MADDGPKYLFVHFCLHDDDDYNDDDHYVGDKYDDDDYVGDDVGDYDDAGMN